MTTITAPIRVETRLRILELLHAETRLSDVVLRYSPPAGQPLIDAVFFGEVTGTEQVADIRSGRKSYDDRWSDDIWVVTADQGADDGRDAATRCQAYKSIVHDIVADDPKLGALPGLQHVVIDGDSFGPNCYPLTTDTQVIGWGASWKFQLSCYARIS